MTWRESRSFVPNPTFASHPDTWPNGISLPDHVAPSFGAWADTDEERIVNPVTGGAKGRKLARHELLPPEALTAIAERFGLGAQKYEDNNWRKGYSWSLSYGALQRHLLAFWTKSLGIRIWLPQASTSLCYYRSWTTTRTAMTVR